jgi:hypothetical protein
MLGDSSPQVINQGMLFEVTNQSFPEGLAEFTRKAHEYIENMHDPQAKRFALRYTVYLQSKARAIPASEPGAEANLSGPDRSLIRIFLRRLYDEHIKRHRRRAS